MTHAAHYWSLSQYFNLFLVDVYHVSDDSWDDALLTWNNEPDFGGPLGSIQFDDTVTHWKIHQAIIILLIV